MPLVNGLFANPAGDPIGNADVIVTLVAGLLQQPGYTTTATIGGAAGTTTAADGTWSLTLAPNSTYSPADTRYLVAQVDPGTHVRYESLIVVPDEAGPFNLPELVVSS